jgi:outer membrane protein assembly factor BamB
MHYIGSMTYNSFLDTFFSSGWILFGVFIFGFIFFIVMRKKFFEKRKGKTLTTIVLIIMSVGLFLTYGLLNPLFMGYGDAVGIESVKVIDGKLFVVDYIQTSGGKTSSGQECYRMHIADAKTGDKKLRFRIGYAKKIVGAKGDTLVVADYDNVAFYSITDGRRLAVWSKETLPKLFTQLSAGVDEFNCGDGNKIIYVNSLDGKKWKLNSMTGEIKPDVSESETHSPTKKIFIDGRHIKVDDRNDGTNVISLKDVDGNDHQQELYDDDDGVMNQELVFIDGKIVTLDEKAGFFVIMHYETIKKQRFIFTCVSLDGKKLWEARQSVIDPDAPDADGEQVKVSSCYDEQDGLFIITLEKEIVAVNSKDGKVKWRTKF